jgi:hypothetical protein
MYIEKETKQVRNPRGLAEPVNCQQTIHDYYWRQREEAEFFCRTHQPASGEADILEHLYDRLAAELLSSVNIEQMNKEF